MFFKKKETKPTAKPEASTGLPASVTTPSATPLTTSDGKPIYQKPVLRRYDQIDQVKPYGPSEI